MPVIPYQAIGAIRSGAYGEHATEHESENKRTNDREDGHRQHFRYSRERPWSSMLIWMQPASRRCHPLDIYRVTQ